MGNPLFNRLFGNPPAANPQQNGGNAAPMQHAQPPVDMRQAMSELQAHPAQLIRQAGFSVPDELANDPHAAAMHIIQSGQVKSPLLQRLQPIINMMSGRR